MVRDVCVGVVILVVGFWMAKDREDLCVLSNG